MLNSFLIQNFTKEEIVDRFNNLDLEQKVNVCNDFSYVSDINKDDCGKYYLRDFGYRIFAKQYKSKLFSKITGWTKGVAFFYIKSLEELAQEQKIKNLVNK